MARIRSIHPGLWTDEAFMSLSAYARLLYIGLLNEAFDDGVFEWKPLTIKARVFPVDNVNVGELLGELARANMIARADKHEKQPGVIRNFQRYQRPKKPNSSGLLPSEWKDYVGAGDASSEPVPNQFSTGGEKPPQMEDGGGSSDADASAPPNDPRIRLWSEGVDTLVSISGKTRDGAKALIGKWLKATDDDCALVLSRIRKAKLDRIGEPVSWITAALAKKADPPKARNAGVLALQQLRGMNLDDTSPQNRHLDAGDRNPSSASPGIARRVAVTGSG